MTKRNEEDDDVWDEISSQAKDSDDDLYSGGSDVAPLEESSSQATSSGHSSSRNSFELFGFTKYSIVAISYSRWIFLGTLLLAAAGLTTGIFLTLDRGQYGDFTVQVIYPHIFAWRDWNVFRFTY
jgi:hypothetical protein